MFPQKKHLTLFVLGRPVVGAGGAAAAAAAGGRDDSATVTLRFFGFSVADRILTRLMYTRNMITFGGPDVEVVEESLVQSTTVTRRLTAQSGERRTAFCCEHFVCTGLQPPLSQ